MSKSRYNLPTSTSPKLHTAYPVGMLCTVAKACLGNPAGSVAVVYEAYQIGESHHGASLIFPNGNYDGFSDQCMEIFEVNPVRFERSCAEYKFRNVCNLAIDFSKGLFNKAFV
ncbi:hypothetical protein [Alteromonas gilva]|uniref:Uncharacterized protein n=1 Tax=Alteromonas gilva TaxID=2987522 RepID=A0ABT5L6Z8_9ALTE|nr:hypothetical protein [Alteromonas gilva]MDC8832801.1 hypothetical protein [Alteromonas gilva]